MPDATLSHNSTQASAKTPDLGPVLYLPGVSAHKRQPATPENDPQPPKCSLTTPGQISS